MQQLFETQTYYTVLIVMSLLAVIVFLSLQRIEAGYGVAYTPRWGPTVNNRLGWILMEAPVFCAMIVLWTLSTRPTTLPVAVMACFFLGHYFQRSFIFPLLIRGRGRMPITIILMGITFNLVNAYMIGGWLFYVSPSGTYPMGWLVSWQFIVGTVIFGWGMYTNIQSDSIIRNLRRPGDTRHYLPEGGMFRYVAGANYLGELAEWIGYAILTWSWGGAVFALWTFANLAPRARKLWYRYAAEFGPEFTQQKRRYIIPFLY